MCWAVCALGRAAAVFRSSVPDTAAARRAASLFSAAARVCIRRRLCLLHPHPILASRLLLRFLCPRFSNLPFHCLPLMFLKNTRCAPSGHAKPSISSGPWRLRVPWTGSGGQRISRACTQIPPYTSAADRTPDAVLPPTLSVTGLFGIDPCALIS